MNALIISAVSGVIMMFGGFLLKDKNTIRIIANILLLIIIAAVVFELNGYSFFEINTRGMMLFDRFALLFTFIATVSTFVFFLLSGKDMEKVGIHYSDYFALLFFIISGIILVSSFQSLLMLFLGIETISIPLYILTGSDKSSLKSNEASLKYFLMGMRRSPPQPELRK